MVYIFVLIVNYNGLTVYVTP